MWLSIQLVRDLSIWSIDWLLLDKMFNLLEGNELWWIMEIWLLKMVYLLSASWALQSILCLTIEKWSKLLRGAHPRESNFCLTIEFGLTIKICVSAAMSSLLHNGYVPKNVQWTWQFTNRPIRHPSFFLTRTTWKGTNEKKHAIVHLKIGLCLTGPTNSYWTHSLTRCWLALCPNEMV